MNIKLKRIAAMFALSLFTIAANTSAQDEPTDGSTGPEQTSDESVSLQTTSDPAISTDRLSLLLKPLTKDELLAETEGWRDLLKANIQEITDTEIAVRNLKQGSGEGSTPPDTDSETQGELSEKLQTLQEAKGGLIRRFDIVIKAYENKGGDGEEFRKYLTAVSEIDIEHADAATLWTLFRSWLTSEDGGKRWVWQLVKFFIILLVFWIVARIAGRMVQRAMASQKGMSDLLKEFLNTMVRRLILFIGLLVAISTLGVNVSAMVALLGGGAFIIGFALQDTLGNFAAGLMLLIYRPFDVGDAVEVGGVNGSVSKVSMVSTTIRTFDNKIVLVPNKKVWGEVITNASATERRRVDMVFGIGYDDDIKLASEILEKVVKEHEQVLEDPAPVVKVNELADSSVNFICRPWVDTPNYWNVYWDVTRRVKEEFDANGISIPFPQQDVHMYQVVANPEVAKPEEE